MGPVFYVNHYTSRVPTKKQKRHRQISYIEDIVTHFTVDEFKTFFRMSRVSMQYLKDKICEICNEQNVSGITDRLSSGGSVQKPLNERLLILMWYMASLDKYSSIADRFGISESTACCAVRNLLHFMNEYLLEELVVWPTAEEKREIQDMYNELKRFPGIVGFIDGTHIQIKKPYVRGIDYYNRKDYYSIILQAVVREDMRFIDVYAGWPGKVHDARVFRNSPLYAHGQDLCRAGHLLGDSAYPNLPWLLTPFRDTGNLSDIQKKYNTTHASIRNTVERGFGLLKGRFTRLQYVNQTHTVTTVRTILCACILHNICILNDEGVYDTFYEDPLPEMEPNVCQFNADQLETAAVKRLAIARRL